MARRRAGGRASRAPAAGAASRAGRLGQGLLHQGRAAARHWPLHLGRGGWEGPPLHRAVPLRLLPSER
eukprot:8108897-Pyramimonas_sp.AAC.1